VQLNSNDLSKEEVEIEISKAKEGILFIFEFRKNFCFSSEIS
jgi:hypothetical protein